MARAFAFAIPMSGECRRQANQSHYRRWESIVVLARIGFPFLVRCMSLDPHTFDHDTRPHYIHSVANEFGGESLGMQTREWRRLRQKAVDPLHH